MQALIEPWRLWSQSVPAFSGHIDVGQRTNCNPQLLGTVRDSSCVMERARTAVFEAYSRLCDRPWMRGRITMGETLLWALGYPATIKLRVGSVELLLDPRDKASRFVLFRAHERQEIEFLRRLLRPGDCAIDVGAHVGYLAAVIADCVGERGHVIAVEPHPDNFGRLAAAASGAGSMFEALHAAVTDHETEARGRTPLFLDSRNSMWSTTEPSLAAGESILVEAISLDTLVERYGLPEPALIKIDVEGAEDRVLAGYQESIARGHRPVFLVEVKSHEPQDRLAVRSLIPSDYALYRLQNGGRLSLLPPDEDSAIVGTENIVAISSATDDSRR